MLALRRAVSYLSALEGNLSPSYLMTAAKPATNRQRAPRLRWQMVANFGDWKPQVRNFRVCPCAHEVRAWVFLAGPFFRGHGVGYGWIKDKARNETGKKKKPSPPKREQEKT